MHQLPVFKMPELMNLVEGSNQSQDSAVQDSAGPIRQFQVGSKSWLYSEYVCASNNNTRTMANKDKIVILMKWMKKNGDSSLQTTAWLVHIISKQMMFWSHQPMQRILAWRPKKIRRWRTLNPLSVAGTQVRNWSNTHPIGQLNHFICWRKETTAFDITPRHPEPYELFHKTGVQATEVWEHNVSAASEQSGLINTVQQAKKMAIPWIHVIDESHVSVEDTKSEFEETMAKSSFSQDSYQGSA